MSFPNLTCSEQCNEKGVRKNNFYNFCAIFTLPMIVYSLVAFIFATKKKAFRFFLLDSKIFTEVRRSMLICTKAYSLHM